jgi:predicted metal-dependent phosphoesterase TrpH
MKRNSLKANLHVHSKHSTRPSEWFLRRIGCAESYTDPLLLYEIAMKRGMDLVTITDHNTLAGSLEIAHLDNTFISEEITTYFPEDGCKLHIVAYGITVCQHSDLKYSRACDFFDGRKPPDLNRLRNSREPERECSFA